MNRAVSKIVDPSGSGGSNPPLSEKEFMDTSMKKQFPFSFYNPGQFSDIIYLPIAKDVWAFLTEDESVKLMKQAVSKELPAVDPLDEQLKNMLINQYFGSDKEAEHFKTMCLNMIKQIMEHLGYFCAACIFQPKGYYFTTAGLFKLNLSKIKESQDSS